MLVKEEKIRMSPFYVEGGRKCNLIIPLRILPRKFSVQCIFYDSSFSFDLVNIQPVDPLNNIAVPCCMKPESSFNHFLQSFLFGPPLHSDSVNRTHGSCAICSVLAVNENWGLLVVSHNLQEFEIDCPLLRNSD